jgi:hypothetical protein
MIALGKLMESISFMEHRKTGYWIMAWGYILFYFFSTGDWI